MIFSAVVKVQWQHFSGVVVRFRNTYVEFLQDSAHQNYIGLFLTELFKIIKLWPILGHIVVIVVVVA